MSDSLQKLLHDAPVLLAVVDTSLSCFELSSAWRDLLGIGRTNSVTLPVANLFDAVDQGRVVARLRATTMDGRAVRGLAATLTTAARPLPARLWCWQVPAGDGSGSWTVLAAYDAVRTGQFLGETRLHSLHQQVLEAAGDGVISVDDLGRATFINTAATRMLDAQPEDIVGHPLHDVLRPANGAGEHYERDDSPIRRAAKGGETVRGEDELFYRIDGSQLPVAFVCTPIWLKERVNGATLVFRDNSQARSLELARGQAEEEIIALKQQLELEREYLRAQQAESAAEADTLVAESRSYKRTLEQLHAVAGTDANVLLFGEPGVGKETLGGIVHFHSARAERPLVRVHCACSTHEAIEAELFGQLRDTGGDDHHERVGRLELAMNGTLLLDEVADLPVSVQHRLLRLLEDNDPALDAPDAGQNPIRIIATTSQDLDAAVAAGDFLEALYDRLAVFAIRVPPLRERQEDILPLAHRFLVTISRELGREAPKLNQLQIRELGAHHWTGNMRELHNVIEHAVILSDGEKLRLDLALPTLARARHDARSELRNLPKEIRTDEEIREIERANMVLALRQCGGRVSGPDGAAQLLGLKASTMTYRMKHFEIGRDEIIHPTTSRAVTP